MKKRKLGIIGGSGLYKMEGFEKTKWKKVNTPWGKPSDEILLASIGKEEICFIPRHARGHKINPTNINFRANIDAMKQLGVTDLISVSAVGSLKDVSGGNGAYGIRYTLADAFGSGVKVDAFYTPGTGDASAEKGVAGVTGSQEDTYEVTLTGAVPMVDGLEFGLGHSHTDHHNDTAGAADSQDSDEGTAYLKYSIGGLSLGAQRSVDNTSGTGEVLYDTEYYGVSYAISDNLSVSYNTIESTKSDSTMGNDESATEQDFDSISLSYTSGGMTISASMMSLETECPS